MIRFWSIIMIESRLLISTKIWYLKKNMYNLCCMFLCLLEIMWNIDKSSRERYLDKFFDALKRELNNLEKNVSKLFKEKASTWEKKLDKANENWSYITIRSLKEFQNCNHYLVKKIYNDKNVNWMFFKALKDGYSIKFLKSRETDKSPSLSLDEITKPKEILGNELKGKTFVLDPGHGSLDIWSVGLAQYWDAKNKEKITVYEAPTMMDFTYRVARLLRAHWAKVHLTHYMNRRWILDVKDLPPCSMVRDKQNNEVFQDIWDWMPSDAVWSFFNADGSYLVKRAKIANEHNADFYISFHADFLWNKDKGVVDFNSKVLSIRYDKRQVKSEQSENFANALFENGFWYYYNWKLARDVHRNVVSQRLWALSSAKSTAILLETANICQENQAYILRLSEKRQALAESFVSSIIKTLGKHPKSTKSTKDSLESPQKIELKPENESNKKNNDKNIDNKYPKEINSPREYKVYKLWLGTSEIIKSDIQKAKTKISENSKLSNILKWEDFKFETILPIIIKESMMNNSAVSRTWAVGYFQLKETAVDDVINTFWLGNLRLNYKDSVDNIIIWVLYKKILLERVKKRCNFSGSDLENIMILSYNAWDTRIRGLFQKSNFKNYQEFERFLAKRLWVSKAPTQKKDGTYWVKYMDPLTDLKYDSLKSREDQKIAEWLRYVAVINGIKSYFNNAEKIRVIWKITCDKDNTLFSNVKALRDWGKFRNNASVNEICKVILESNGYWENVPYWVDLLLIEEALKDFLPKP